MRINSPKQKFIFLESTIFNNFTFFFLNVTLLLHDKHILNKINYSNFNIEDLFGRNDKK